MLSLCRPKDSSKKDDREPAQERMVERHLVERGIESPRPVLARFARCPAIGFYRMEPSQPGV